MGMAAILFKWALTIWINIWFPFRRRFHMKKTGLMVSGEGWGKSFKDVDEDQHWQRKASDHNSSSWAFGSGEVKQKKNNKKTNTLH